MPARLKVFFAAHSHLSIFLGFILSLILLAGVTWVVAWRASGQSNFSSSITGKINSIVNRSSLPACASPVFSVSPVRVAELDNIAPLGHVNPPDHTIPTDHIYLNLPRVGNNATAPVQVVSPGKMFLDEVEVVNYLDASGKVLNSDYSLRFSPCQGIDGYFHHMTALSRGLQDKIDQTGQDCLAPYQINSGGANAAQRCRYEVGLSLLAGDDLGKVGGGRSAGLDMGLTDTNAPELVFANPKRYQTSNRHTVCPIDYFETSVKAQLEQKLGLRDGKKRTIPPLCGSIAQDKIGSLQGNWFYGQDFQDVPEAWTKELVVIHSNYDPAVGEVVVGGVVGVAGTWPFAPTHTGTYNREPSEVTADGSVYCYDLVQYATPGTFNRILFKLTNESTLQVEEQTGKCSPSSTLSSFAKTYYR